jgi:Ca2+ transporting ATPase
LDSDTKIVYVMRDGKEKDIHKNYIMCGDILKVVDGMDIPVDGILV